MALCANEYDSFRAFVYASTRAGAFAARSRNKVPTRPDEIGGIPRVATRLAAKRGPRAFRPRRTPHHRTRVSARPTWLAPGKGCVECRRAGLEAHAAERPPTGG